MSTVGPSDGHFGFAPDPFSFYNIRSSTSLLALGKKCGQEQLCYAHKPTSGLTTRVPHCGLDHSKVRDIEPGGQNRSHTQ